MADISVTSGYDGLNLPYSPEAEQSVLGAVLLDSSCLDRIAEILPRAEYFHLANHRMIYDAMLEMFTLGQPVDFVTVLDKLKQQILSDNAAKQEDSRLEISRLRRRIGELEHMTAKLYEDKVSGVINGDTFAVLIQKSEQERIQKADRLDALLSEERKARQEVENIRQWAGIVRRYLDVQELDRKIVEELIDHIEIGERSVIDGQRHQDIKIFYRFVGVV